VGYLELTVDCKRFEVIYSSSWAATYTQASWKKEFLEDDSEDKSSEWHGVGPIRDANDSSYCRMLT
jgi:hypothetical protein